MGHTHRQAHHGGTHLGNVNNAKIIWIPHFTMWSDGLEQNYAQNVVSVLTIKLLVMLILSFVMRVCMGECDRCWK